MLYDSVNDMPLKVQKVISFEKRTSRAILQVSRRKIISTSEPVHRPRNYSRQILFKTS